MRKILLCLTISCIVLSSCGSTQTFDSSQPFGELPIGKKKKKRKIHATYAFSSAVKRYTKEKGHFPFDMQSFEYYSDYTRAGVQSMRDAGFHYLFISYQYLDSMVIDFAHYPVYTAPVSREISVGVDLTGRIVFTKKDSSIVEFRQFDKKVRGGHTHITHRPDTAGQYRRLRYGY